MSERNVEIVRAAVDAFNRRDWAEWEELSSPEVEIDWSASRGLEARVYRGREETRDFIHTFDTFESVDIEPEEFTEAGDSVVVSNTTRFRGRDGIETTARSGVVYEVRRGQVTRICLFQSVTDALEAVGLAE